MENFLKEHEHVCNLRLGMPISSDVGMVKKIVQYDKAAADIPTSMTVLDELLPIAIEMAKRKLKGTWNLTNPGVINHNELQKMYREYIDPNFKCPNLGQGEDHHAMTVAPNLKLNNHEMDVSKLMKEFPEILPIRESLIKYVFGPNQKKFTV